MHIAVRSLTTFVFCVAPDCFCALLRSADSISEGRAGGDEEEGRGQPEAHAGHIAREKKYH